MVLNCINLTSPIGLARSTWVDCVCDCWPVTGLHDIQKGNANDHEVLLLPPHR